MIYTLILTPQAQKHLDEWSKSGQVKSIQKIATLLEELTQHPKTGTGQVEQLRGNLSGYWSRRINRSDRIIYSVEDEKVTVTVISMKGHY